MGGWEGGRERDGKGEGGRQGVRGRKRKQEGRGERDVRSDDGFAERYCVSSAAVICVWW